MANLALPEPEDEYDYESPFLFVLQGKHRLASRVIEECLRDSTSLYLIAQERLVSAGNC